MQKLLLLTAILLSGTILYAQQLDGTYKNETDSIAFSNGKVTFCVSGFGGLSSAQAGEGTYELADNFLIIHTEEYSGNKTSFDESEGTAKDTCIVQTVGPQNYAAQGVLVESRNKSGKLIDGKVTGNDGKIFLTPCDKIATISASSLGYNSISFDYTPGKNYRIKMAENDIIENKTVVFNVNHVDDETLSVLMLSDDFNNDKDREKELGKLKKKAKKNNKLDKRLKKVYIPYSKRD